MQTLKAKRNDPSVDFSRSPHAAVRPVPLSTVELTGFWGRREAINREAAIPHGLRMLEETGGIEAFEIAAGASQATLRGFVYRDSDLYKWLEAAAYAGVRETETIIRKIAAAQTGDGYVNTSFANENSSNRLTNLAVNHEIYCAGHLIQAGIAQSRARGDDSLLDVATKFADFLYSEFGPEGHVGTGGHPVAEMALVELFRYSGDQKYLDLAHRFIEARGRGVLGGKEYLQDHAPFLNQKAAVGHAVRALYLYAGAADYYLESGDEQYLGTLETLYEDVKQKTYLTGGIGARHEGEAFGEPYELPDSRAYAETCAVIASMMWNWRMFAATAHPKYLDDIEIAMYNGFLSGMSAYGLSYFYVNPLASSGGHQRQPWYDCACCPPNIYRTIASIKGMFFAQNRTDLYCNFYDACSIETQNLKLKMQTDYPASGSVSISVESITDFRLHLRIPSWSREAKISWDHRSATAPPGFFTVENPKNMQIEFAMSPEFVFTHPRIGDKAALRRGPIIYCAESIDNPGCDIDDLCLNPDNPISTSQPGPDSIPRLKASARSYDASPDLYQFQQPKTQPEEIAINAVPYYSWANRGPGKMRVWFPICR
jgi:DUF1680 family protein